MRFVIEPPTKLLMHCTGAVIAPLMALAWVTQFAAADYVPTFNDEMAAASVNDPRIGTLADGLPNTNGSAQGFNVVVVVFSDCSECSRSKYRLLVDYASGVDTRFIAAVLEEDPKRTGFKSTSNVDVVRASEAIRQKWNVIFQPRVYAVKSNANFAYVQPYDVPFAQALSDASEVLKSSK
jgi:hypothetical protein